MAAMPEPITAATRNAVPTTSASARRPSRVTLADAADQGGQVGQGPARTR